MRRLLIGYRSFALMLANTFALFVGLNFVLQCVDWLCPTKQVSPFPKEWVFRPYVQYAESATPNSRTPFRDDFGFEYRALRALSREEMRGAIFLVGADSVVGDLPRDLEEKLGRPVVSYGARGYQPFQMTLLAERLIQAGHRPRILVFLDPSSPSNVPATNAALRSIWERSQYDWLFLPLPEQVPVFRWVNRLRERYFESRLVAEGKHRYPFNESEASFDREAIVRVRRSLANTVRGRAFSLTEESGKTAREIASRIENEIVSSL